MKELNDEIFFEYNNLKIFNKDFLDISSLDNNSIDLIITSPPYNLNIEYLSYDDKREYDNYLTFSKLWLCKSHDLLKEDGRMCLNIPLDKNKDGKQSVYADIVNIAKNIGYKYQSTIVWNEQNVSRRTAWGSWLSPSAPYVIAPVEMILLLYKSKWKKKDKDNKISDIKKEEFLEWTNGVWNFSGESKKRVKHPAPFPIELPKRCIKLFSYKHDTVLDPFLGSGTTLIATSLLDRKGIGVELDTNYCKLAKKRIINEGNLYQSKL